MTTEAFQSNGIRKARTSKRRDLQVPAFWIKPGCIFHLPAVGPRRSIANCQVDNGWWNHPILVLNYNRVTERAEVLLISTLHGRTIEESYDPGVTMRKRLLYIEDSKDVKLPEGVPTLRIEHGFHELYEQSYVKINAPVVVEREFIHNLDRGKSVKLDKSSMTIVNTYLENYMKSEDLNMEEVYSLIDEYTSGMKSKLGQALSTPASLVSTMSIQRSRATPTASPATPLWLRQKKMDFSQWNNWGNANVMRMGTIGQSSPTSTRSVTSSGEDSEEERKEGEGERKESESEQKAK